MVKGGAKKFSIYFLYAVAIFTMVTVYELAFFAQDEFKVYNLDRAEKVNLLYDHAYQASLYYKAVRDEASLVDFLENRRRLSQIDFWILARDGAVMQTSVEDQELAVLKPRTFGQEAAAPSNLTDELSKNKSGALDDKYFFSNLPLDDGYVLVVGLRHTPLGLLNFELNALKGVLASYLFGLFLICLGTFFYFFRDVAAIIKAVTARKGSARQKAVVHSREAEVLSQGVDAYQEKNRQLEKEKSSLSLQVLPSLSTELMSGRKPPYTFECALVRTDINNFSKIYNEHPVEEFAATINEFFIDVSHVVSRYGGYVHEFVGDEVIYYFKDKEVGNSPAMALAAIVEINAAAERYHELTSKQRGYDFKVKSSLAGGNLRFGRFVNAFGIAGPPLIESVRLLSLVTEKDENAIVFDSRLVPQLEVIARTEFVNEVSLKGFSGTRRMHAFRERRTLEDILGAAGATDFDRIRYYRSDRDLAAVFGWLKREWKSRTAVEILGIVSVLRGARLTRSDGTPKLALSAWLEELSEAPANDSAKGDRFVLLASAVRLVENMIPKEELDDSVITLLRKIAQAEDGRVVANALDALTVLRAEQPAPESPAWVTELADHSFNRVAANAVVHDGLGLITPKIVKRLAKMLKADDPSRVSSGLWALGELALFHRERDLVHFQTQLDFQNLLKTVPEFVFHPDVSVRSQALLAAMKSADLAVIDAIFEKRSLAPESKLARDVGEEIESVLGTKHKPKAAS